MRPNLEPSQCEQQDPPRERGTARAEGLPPIDAAAVVESVEERIGLEEPPRG